MRNSVQCSVYLCRPLPSRIAQWFQHHMSCLFTISRLARDMERRGKLSANEDGPVAEEDGGRRGTDDGTDRRTEEEEEDDDDTDTTS